MLRIKYLKQDPNSVPLSNLSPGSVFKTSKGQTPYMVIYIQHKFVIPSVSIAVVSLESGQLHFFSHNHSVIELEGTLELHKVKIERGKR